MNRCRASSLGDCEGPLSDEHSVSGGLFDDPLLKVSGFDWCNGAVKEIPRARLVQRILCREHNGRLSPLDKAAATRQLVAGTWHYRRSGLLGTERNAQGAVPVLLTLQQFDINFKGCGTTRPILHHLILNPTLSETRRNAKSILFG